MKILAFTDTHCNKMAHKKIKERTEFFKPDLLVSCGDISVFTSGLEESAKFIEGLGISCLIIPGNHESESDIKEICKKYKNLINIHSGCYEVGNILFFGYGTGGFSYRDEKFDRISKQFIKTLEKNKKLIFVTHAPVYKTKLDLIMNEHRGCISSREFIEKTKPFLTLCGHFHENENKQDNIGESLIINPGKFGRIIEI